MTSPILAVVLVVGVLSVVRLSRLVAVDQIFHPLRDFVRGRLGPDSQVTYLFFCVWCLSVWFGVGVGAVLWWATPVGSTLLSEGVEWWIGVPAFTLVSSWVTGMLWKVEESL